LRFCYEDGFLRESDGLAICGDDILGKGDGKAVVELFATAFIPE
jgi:hypothetical protein